MLQEKSEAVGTLNRLQSDLEDLKRSNAGFEKENINLVEERNKNLQHITELSTDKSSLESKLTESDKNYQELLKAKDIETENFNESMNKLIKFKNIANERIEKDKQQLDQSNKDIETYKNKVIELTQQL